jgi:hypothetical protein
MVDFDVFKTFEKMLKQVDHKKDIANSQTTLLGVVTPN